MAEQNRLYEMTNQAFTEARPSAESVTGMVPDSLFDILWNNRWVLLICVILSLTIGFIYVMKATPIFTSTSRIYVEQIGPRVIEDVRGAQSNNYIFTQAELIKSTPIISAILERPEIRKMRSFDRTDNPLAYLKKKLHATVGKKDDIVSISFDSPYPEEAALLVNSVVDSYITLQSTRKKGTALEILKILQTQKQKSQTELDAKRTTLLDFQKQNPVLTFETRQGNIVLERLASLSESLTKAELRTVESRSTYESFKSMVSDPQKLKQFVDAQRAKNVYVSGASESTQIMAQLKEVELQIEERKRLLTPDHPAVTSLMQQKMQLQEQLNGLDQTFAWAQLSVAEQDFLTAQESENQIRTFYNQQRLDALDLNEKTTEYSILRSDIQRMENLLTILDDRIKEVNVTEDTGALNISIVEVARPEEKPTKPQKSRIMAMALVLGLMLGGAGSLARDWMDTRLRSVEEVSFVLGTPVLGTVPRMSQKNSISDRGMIVHKQPSSNTAEAYRTIRTAIFFGVPAGMAKTMLVTSPTPGDGKTTLTSNLAIALAQADQKTLLIDADVRKAMQHVIFELAVEPGLTSHIAGRATFEECIRKNVIPNLDIIPAGPEVVNPSEMLNSVAFHTFITRAKELYDRIIIDSPPVMPVTDSRILAAGSDITILVLRAGKSTRKGSQEARDGLRAVGARLLGAVVNDVSKNDSQYGRYSRYGHYGSSSYYGRPRESAAPKSETV